MVGQASWSTYQVGKRCSTKIGQASWSTYQVGTHVQPWQDTQAGVGATELQPQQDTQSVVSAIPRNSTNVGHSSRSSYQLQQFNHSRAIKQQYLLQRLNQGGTLKQEQLLGAVVQPQQGNQAVVSATVVQLWKAVTIGEKIFDTFELYYQTQNTTGESGYCYCALQQRQEIQELVTRAVPPWKGNQAVKSTIPRGSTMVGEVFFPFGPTGLKHFNFFGPKFSFNLFSVTRGVGVTFQLFTF